MTLVELISEGNQVAMHQKWSGTHTGEFMGILATNPSFSVDIFEIIRFADGKMVERWGVADTMGLMQQLGLTPDPA